ncbi:trigger factor [soil metagenome]
MAAYWPPGITGPSLYPVGSVKSAVEPLEGHRVKVSVNIDEAEFDRDIDQAFRKIAREVRLPGFRAGKAPRRVLEARIGLAPAREQALRDAIPTYLARAVREHDVDLIATPEVEVTGGAESGPVDFDATCEVRPEITVAGYGGLRVEMPNPEPTDDEVDDALRSQLRRHGELADVDRPAARGDLVVVDVAASRDGEDVPSYSTEDWSYEIGQGFLSEDFDDQLVGASAGDHVTFTTTPIRADEPADFIVDVQRVQELVLPEVSDEWVAEHVAEFDTEADWRTATRQRLGTMKLQQVQRELVGRVTAALTELTEIEAPESLVQSDLQQRVRGTVGQLQAQGIDLEQWMSVTGQDPASFVEGLKGASEQAVRVDLALRAVAQAEAIDADEGDLAAEYERLALRTGEKPNQLRKAYERNDLVPELAAQIRTAKALDWLLHHVDFVDPDGVPLDRDVVLGHTHDDDDHHDDHVHDHHDHAADAADPADVDAPETEAVPT